MERRVSSHQLNAGFAQFAMVYFSTFLLERVLSCKTALLVFSAVRFEKTAQKKPKISQISNLAQNPHKSDKRTEQLSIPLIWREVSRISESSWKTLQKLSESSLKTLRKQAL